MSDTNLAALLHGKGDLRLEEIAVPEPGQGEVQISVHSTGICGTDIHLYKEGGFGKFHWTSPYALGHESSGIVSKLGHGVTHLKVGDRVAVEPGYACGKCNFCKKGRANLCSKMIVVGFPTVHGLLARYLVTTADCCFKLPDHVSFEEGAMIEPLSVAVHAFRRCRMSIGDTVLVCGAGTIGLMCLSVAKAMGASAVVITDLCPNRLALAKTIGADHTVLVTTEDAEKVAVQVITALGAPADVTFDCVGCDASVRAGVCATERGGVLVLVGVEHEHVTLPLQDVVCREVDIVPSVQYVNT